MASVLEVPNDLTIHFQACGHTDVEENVSGAAVSKNHPQTIEDVGECRACRQVRIDQDTNDNAAWRAAEVEEQKKKMRATLRDAYRVILDEACESLSEEKKQAVNAGFTQLFELLEGREDQILEDRQEASDYRLQLERTRLDISKEEKDNVKREQKLQADRAQFDEERKSWQRVADLKMATLSMQELEATRRELKAERIERETQRKLRTLAQERITKAYRLLHSGECALQPRQAPPRPPRPEGVSLEIDDADIHSQSSGDQPLLEYQTQKDEQATFSNVINPTSPADLITAAPGPGIAKAGRFAGFKTRRNTAAYALHNPAEDEDEFERTEASKLLDAGRARDNLT